MEIYQLRTFVTVAQQGHLTQAAELLHLSQPAVTAQIKALEEEVGMPLFERTAGGVNLSRAGQELLPQAHVILQASRDMLNHARAFKGQLAGKAIIGTITTPEMINVGPWVAALIEKYPLLDLQLQHGVTGLVLNRVRKKELDAGFFIGKNPYINVNTIKLTDLNFRIVAPATWRDRIEGASAKALGKLPWIGMSPLSSLNKLTSELWRDMNISPRKVAEVDHVPAVSSLVQAGIGLAIMREDEALALQAEGKLMVVGDWVKATTLQFIYAADRAGDLVLNVLIAELETVWGTSASMTSAMAES